MLNEQVFDATLGDMTNETTSVPSIDIAKPVLRVPEVCELLGISRAHLYRIVERGEITAVRMGRSVRFLAEDVRSFLAAHREVA